MIESPSIQKSSAYLGSLFCSWNITAPDNKKIVIKFENFSMEHSDYCSFDYVELFNGTKLEDKFRLAKICGNLSQTIKPIVIDNNQAVLRLKTDQTNNYVGFTAAIYFMPKCDLNINLTVDKPTYVLDRSNQLYDEAGECIFKVVSEPMSTVKIVFDEMHLSPCDPDRNRTSCDCDYVEVLDGNGPFSEVIGRYCGHDSPPIVYSTQSGVYMRFVTDSIKSSTGFKATISMTESPCGIRPYRNFTGNETNWDFLVAPIAPGGKKYLPNIRCMWIAEAPYGKIFEIQFEKFDLEDSENCANDSLTLEDSNVKEFIAEGLGEEVIYRGKGSTAYMPSFYSGMAGPTAPHIYCGSSLPHEYISQTNKVKIKFNTDSLNEFGGFNITLRTVKSCSRNFTALQGRIVSSDQPEDCVTTITVPDNYTIALFFNKFFMYESDCTKSSVMIYDGSIANAVLLKTLCGYVMPDPIFSTKNQLTINFHYDENSQHYSRGNYDLMYLATDKGQGCGGSIYNYGGMFTSPLYPSSNRTRNDCTWSVKVPQNLKVALRFSSEFFD